MAKVNFNWPKKDDNLFVEGDLTLNSPTTSNLDWISNSRSDVILAIAFKESGDRIVNNLHSRKDSIHADYYFFPILYLYRHSLELLLKDIIMMGIIMGIIESNRKIKNIIEKHGLHPLWNKAKFIIDKIFPEEKDNEASKSAERLIQQIHNIDPGGFSLRYFFRKDGNKTIDEYPKYVALENLKVKFDGLYNYISASMDGVYECLSNSPYY